MSPLLYYYMLLLMEYTEEQIKDMLSYLIDNESEYVNLNLSILHHYDRDNRPMWVSEITIKFNNL